MGFFERLERGIDDFFDFSPSAYRCEISNLGENELREVHKQIQRKVVGAGTQIAGGAAGAAASGGLTLVFSGIGLRRAKVNSQKCDIIEARLKEQGWRRHEFGFKDILVGAGPGAAAAVLLPGADHIANHVISHATHHVTAQGVAAHAAAHGAAHGAAHATSHAAVHTTSHVHSTVANIGTKAVEKGVHSGAKKGIKAATSYAIERWIEDPANVPTESTARKPAPSIKDKAVDPKAIEWSSTEASAVPKAAVPARAEAKPNDSNSKTVKPTSSRPPEIAPIVPEYVVITPTSSQQILQDAHVPTKTSDARYANEKEVVVSDADRRNIHLGRLMLTVLHLAFATLLGETSAHFLVFGATGLLVMSPMRANRRTSIELVLLSLVLHFVGYPAMCCVSILRNLIQLHTGARLHGQPFSGIVYTSLVFMSVFFAAGASLLWVATLGLLVVALFAYGSGGQSFRAKLQGPVCICILTAVEYQLWRYAVGVNTKP